MNTKNLCIVAFNTKKTLNLTGLAAELNLISSFSLVLAVTWESEGRMSCLDIFPVE